MTSPATLTVSYLPTCMLKLPHSNYTLFSRQNMKAKGALACTLVPLPHISYFCHCGLTDSLTEDGGLVSPNIPLPNILLPLTQTPTCQALTQLCQASNSFWNLTFCVTSSTCTVAPQEVLLDHWTSPRCQMGSKGCLFRSQRFAGRWPNETLNFRFFYPYKTA